jgi:hypothetical protein
VPDYFAPAFWVEIDGTTLAADISSNIQEVSVVSQSNTMDTFKFTLVDPHE